MKRSAREFKNASIAISRAATKDKRESQVCRVRTLKIQMNKLSAKHRESLQMMFVEAKWLTNALIGWINFGFKMSDYPVLARSVYHFDKDGNEILSDLHYLGSQMKQSISAGILTNIKVLGVLKTNGHKVGKLKFRRECKSIELKQHNNTYTLRGNRLHLQGIKGWINVSGADQITSEHEIANAKLLCKPDGYYLAVTVYSDKDDEPKPKKKEIGLDFGCENSITLSDGRKFNTRIRETDRLKRLQRKLACQQERSKGWLRTIKLIKTEYQKMANRKDDAVNKIVHEIKQYRDIYMQDEMLKSWHRSHFSKTVQHSILGRLKAKLKPIAKSVLPASAPTTQLCYKCGQRRKMPLNRRVYVCDCGINPEDRDVHSAKNMIVIAKRKLRF